MTFSGSNLFANWAWHLKKVWLLVQTLKGRDSKRTLFLMWTSLWGGPEKDIQMLQMSLFIYKKWTLLTLLKTAETTLYYKRARSFETHFIVKGRPFQFERLDEMERSWLYSILVSMHLRSLSSAYACEKINGAENCVPGASFFISFLATIAATERPFNRVLRLGVPMIIMCYGVHSCLKRACTFTIA